VRKTIASMVVALALAGCAAGHLSASYSALCAYHAWRAVHDVHYGHSLLAAFHAWRSVHDCARAAR
jgi:outer membrane lipoprotein SlyB